MAGTVTQGTATKIRFNGHNVWTLNFTWVGDSSTGAVPDTAISAANLALIKGSFLFLIKTVPGTPSPTANYGITLVDADGLDILQGRGLTKSATAIETAVPKQDTAKDLYGPVYVPGTFTFKLSGNSVASAKGIARLYFA